MRGEKFGKGFFAAQEIGFDLGKVAVILFCKNFADELFEFGDGSFEVRGLGECMTYGDAGGKDLLFAINLELCSI